MTDEGLRALATAGCGQNLTVLDFSGERLWERGGGEGGGESSFAGVHVLVEGQRV